MLPFFFHSPCPVWLVSEVNTLAADRKNKTLSTRKSEITICLDQIHFVFQLTGQTKCKIWYSSWIHAQLVIHITHHNKGALLCCVWVVSRSLWSETNSSSFSLRPAGSLLSRTSWVLLCVWWQAAYSSWWTPVQKKLLAIEDVASSTGVCALPWVSNFCQNDRNARGWCGSSYSGKCIATQR